MNKTTPNVTEEHIVAWLDGALTPAPGFENSVKGNSELATAAAEYIALDAAFVRSRTDTRYALPKSVDSRVRASLATEISRSRKTVRLPERAPMAAPIPGSTNVVRTTKNLWARRSAYAMALALMAIFGWFIGHTGEAPQMATNAPVRETNATQSVTTAAPTPSQVADHTNSANTTETTTANVEHTTAMSHVHNPIATSQPQQNVNAPAVQVAETSVAPKQPTPAAEENDPAAIMASHRYAKLIKTTPAVVITAQDQM